MTNNKYFAGEIDSRVEESHHAIETLSVLAVTQ
ncbi:hypothetical protein NUACC26_054080 [Scytonema sp. NUACC26]